MAHTDKITVVSGVFMAHTDYQHSYTQCRACMFPGVSDNVVLDIQKAAPRATATHIAMWTVIVNPLSKVRSVWAFAHCGRFRTLHRPHMQLLPELCVLANTYTFTLGAQKSNTHTTHRSH